MKALAVALVKVQKAIQPALKDSDNPFFKSKYADLTAVWAACREALVANGFAITQTGAFKDGRFFLVTSLLHESGESITGEYLVNPDKKEVKAADGKTRLVDDPQALGSCFTYARRYSLAAIVGVVTEDDDGNNASGNDVKSPTSKPYLDKSEKQAITDFKAKQTAPASEPEQEHREFVDFIPVEVSPKKVKNSEGKLCVAYEIKSPAGPSYDTFNEKFAEIAAAAAMAKALIHIIYVVKGRFNVIKNLELTAEVTS